MHFAFFVELETGRPVGANFVSTAKFSIRAIQKTVKFLCSGFSALSCASSAFVYSVRVVLYCCSLAWCSGLSLPLAGDLMARVFNLDTAAEDIRKNVARSFQSANINFLIGSGASYPAIPSAGTVEEEIASLFEAGNEVAAYLKLYDFLATIQAPTNKLIESLPAPVDAETDLGVEGQAGSVLAEHHPDGGAWSL